MGEQPSDSSTSPEETKRQKYIAEMRKTLEAMKADTSPISDIEHNEEGLISSFKLQGYPVDCTGFPIEKNHVSEVLRNVYEAIEKIKKCKSVKSMPESISLTLIDGIRVEFILEYKGKQTTFVASPRHLFRVEKRTVNFTTPEEEESLPKMKAESRQLLFETGQLIGLSPEEIERSNVMKRKLVGNEWSEKLNRAGVLEEEAKLIEAKQNGRLLVDMETGSKVKEYQYAVPEQEFIWIVSTGEQDASQEKYDGFHAYPCKLKRIEKWNSGELATRDVYDGEGREVDSTQFFKKGKIYQTLHYDTHASGKPYTYITVHQPEDHILFHAQNEQGQDQFIDPFDGQKDMLDILCKALHSKEEYELFEKLYWSKFAEMRGTTREMALIIGLVEHGKRLYGVDEVENRWEQSLNKHGLQVDLRLQPSYGVKGSRAKMEKIAEVIPKLIEATSVFPPQLIHNNPIKHLYILSNLVSNDIGPIGGYYNPNNGIIAVNDRVEGTKAILFHEYGHLGDDVDGGLVGNYGNWVRRFHGDGMDMHDNKIYGKMKRIIGDEKRTHFSVSIHKKGFFRSYSIRNPREDFATICEPLFEKDPIEKLNAKAESDPLLAEKVAHVKRWYYVRSEGRLDDTFWSDVANGVEITPDYWEARESNGDFSSPEIKKLEQYMEWDRNNGGMVIQEKAKQLSRKRANAKSVEEKLETEQKILTLYREAALHNPYGNYSVDYCGSFWRTKLSKQETVPLRIAALTSELEALPVEYHEPKHYESLAEAYEDGDNLDKSIEILQKAISLFPRDYTLKRTLAKTMLVGRKESPPEELLALLEETYEQTRRYKDFTPLMQELERRNDGERVKKLYKSFINEHSDNKEAKEAFETSMLKLGEREVVENSYREVAAANPESEMAALMLPLFLAYKAKDNTAAHAAFLEICKKFPNGNEAHRQAFHFAKWYVNIIEGDDRESVINAYLALQKDVVQKQRNIKLAESLNFYIRNFKSPEHFREACELIHAEFEKNFGSVIRADIILDSKLEDCKKYFPRNESSLFIACREAGDEEAYIFACKRYIKQCSNYINIDDDTMGYAFSSLQLLYESTDTKKAIELCEHFSQYTDLDEHYRRTLRLQNYYLHAKSQAPKWYTPADKKISYAVNPQESGVLYIRGESGNRFTRMERFVPKIVVDDIRWGGIRPGIDIPYEKLPDGLKED